ncbi:MAG TPA: host attachment family protein [Xanthobacteraceae bacterium]|nr:host attachment family protein [Xanthobacteraceae bacterium]
MMRIPSGAWVIVCDGRKALILDNSGDARYPDLRVHAVFERDNPPTRAQGSDAPGRVYASVGKARSAVEQTDWHREAEAYFLSKVAEEINHAVGSGAVRKLVVAAPPRALGVLRPLLCLRARRAVTAEIERDFTRLPAYEIEKRLHAA